MVKLLNISVGGAAIVVKGEVEAILACCDQLEVFLRLPGIETPLSFLAWIRHRKSTEDGICYGLEFVEQEGKRFEDSQEHVIQYVMERQREDLNRKVI